MEITKTLLQDNPLPQLHAGGDKSDRGRLLIVGGSTEMPGTVILAALAALRAGAGKVQVATPSGTAPMIATMLMEGRVFAMPETPAGGLAEGAIDRIIEIGKKANAILVGPGIVDASSLIPLLQRLLSSDAAGIPVILDAAALTVFKQALALISPSEQTRQVLLTPHAGEMAKLMNCEKSEVQNEPQRIVQQAVNQFQVNILLKGVPTFLATVDGKLYRHEVGTIGLATSGSGDTLAGLIGGLAVRGATLSQAAFWSVYIHTQAGKRLSERIGTVGFLARELLPEFPGLLSELAVETAMTSSHWKAKNTG